jgi:hypothetical protein
MTTPIVKVHNVETGEETERPMTAEEFAQWEIDIAASIAREQAKEEQALARAALLERLGITAEEAALLLGGNN